MNIKKARKKPVEIEFMQFKDMGNVDEIETWTNLKAAYVYGNDGIVMYIDTLEGVMTASLGDYIVKGVDGEFYPVKPEIFKKTYEVFFDTKSQEEAEKMVNKPRMLANRGLGTTIKHKPFTEEEKEALFGKDYKKEQ